MATSQYTLTPAQDYARAFCLRFPLRWQEAEQRGLEVQTIEVYECTNGCIGGAPVMRYDAGDASVGYGPEDVAACTLCVAAPAAPAVKTPAPLHCWCLPGTPVVLGTAWLYLRAEWLKSEAVGDYERTIACIDAQLIIEAAAAECVAGGSR